MDNKTLKKITNQLKIDSLTSTTQAGSGHPTSCLSCAEIIATLFFHEMNPNDDFILSKGHAAPILYSALYHKGLIKENLNNLRKISSPLEGHPMPNSLPQIKFATGSLGQGLSIAAGVALANKIKKNNRKVYVLLGDSEIFEGSNYEAIQFSKYYNLGNLTIIIDVNRLGQRGETIFGHKLKEYKKRFQGFGLDVIIIDGHSISKIKNALNKKTKGPKLILAKTFKGNSISFLKDKEDWHGKVLSEKELFEAIKEIPTPNMPKIKSSRFKEIFPSKLKKILITNYKEEASTREAYGNYLKKLTRKNNSTIVLDAEVSNSTYSNRAKKSKFIECFIGEQNMIGVALGLDKSGFNTFSSTFSAFLTRAHDQIRMAAYSNPFNMTICGSHSGVSIGQDGVSQMGLEDIAIFRSVYNSKVFYPSDAISAEIILNEMGNLSGIKYIRTTRAKLPIIYKKNEKFKAGEFKILKQSKKDKVVLIGAGITLHECLKANKKLKIKTAVIDIYSIKPFLHKKLYNFVKKHGNKMIIVEDHYKAGGIGEMILSNTELKIPKSKHLFVDKLPHSGKPEELLKIQEIDFNSIIKEVKNII